MVIRVALLITTLSATVIGLAQAAPAAEAQPQAAKQPADAHCDHAGQLQQLRHAVFAGPGHICDRQEQRPPRACSKTNIGFTRTIVALPWQASCRVPSRHGDLHRHTAPGGSGAQNRIRSTASFNAGQRTRRCGGRPGAPAGLRSVARAGRAWFPYPLQPCLDLPCIGRYHLR